VKKNISEQIKLVQGGIIKFTPMGKAGGNVVYTTKIDKKKNETEFESGKHKFVVGGNTLTKIDDKGNKKQYRIVETIKTNNMKKVIRLTESDLVRLVNKVLSEQQTAGNTGGTPLTKGYSIFSDFEQTKLVASNLIIKSINPSNNGFVVNLETEPGLLGGKSFKGQVFYDCVNLRDYNTKGFKVSGVLSGPTTATQTQPTKLDGNFFGNQLFVFVGRNYCEKDKRFEKKSTQPNIDARGRVAR